MGAWGVHPLESDQGGEFVAVALQETAKQIGKALEKPLRVPIDLDRIGDVRAAAYLLEVIGFQLVYPLSTGGLGQPGLLARHLGLAVSRLQEMLDDKRLTAEWQNNYAAFQADVHRQIGVLGRRVTDLPAAPGAETLASRLEEHMRTRTRATAKKLASRRVKKKTAKKTTAKKTTAKKKARTSR